MSRRSSLRAIAALSLPAAGAVAALGMPGPATAAVVHPAKVCNQQGTVTRTRQANHHKVTLVRGNKLKVDLSENLDGGPNSARWHAEPVTGNGLTLGAHHFHPSTGAPGSPGRFVQYYNSGHSDGAPTKVVLYLKAPGHAITEHMVLHVGIGEVSCPISVGR